MSENYGVIEVISRAVIIENGKLLLCHSKGAMNTYLPGGHVDFGEPAKAALARELKEELGIGSRIMRFLGGVEHSYKRDGDICCEINLVFEASIDLLHPDVNPPSQEDYIEFLWADFDELAACRLEPAVLCECVQRWLTCGSVENNWISSGLLDSRKAQV